jgi:hypothetical protein
VSGYSVRVAAGQASPPVRVFRAGAAEGPLGVGVEGDWVVRAQGVLPVHAFLFFDGETLFAASADRGKPAEIAGSPIGLEWTPVEAGEEILFGGARLEVRLGGAQAAKRAPAPVRAPVTPAAPPVAPSGPVAAVIPAGPRFGPPPGAVAAGPPPAVSAPVASAPMPSVPTRPALPEPEPGGDTRVLPIEQMLRQQRAAQAAAPPPASAPAVSFGAPPSRAVPAPPPSWSGAAPLAPTAPKPAAEPVSAVRKAVYVLMPVAMLSFAYVMFFDEEPAPRPKGKPAASASAKPAASAAASASGAASGAAPEPAPGPDVATGVLAPPPPAVSAVAKGERTPDRKAVDAVASGNYADALAVYKELAAAHPEVPAYAEAVRILTAKTAAGK